MLAVGFLVSRIWRITGKGYLLERAGNTLQACQPLDHVDHSMIALTYHAQILTLLVPEYQTPVALV